MIREWKDYTKGKKMVYGLLLGFPIYISLAWMLSIGVSSVMPLGNVAGVRLSPIRDPKPLIYGLMTFVAGYISFLGILFSRLISKVTTFIKKKKRFLF